MTGRCARCGLPSRDLVVVAVKDSASAGGLTIRWCRPCADAALPEPPAVCEDTAP